MADERRRREAYKWIKIASILSMIPFVLVAGPLAGYFAFDYLKMRFGAPQYLSYILITVGFAASVRETVRIIRIALAAK